MDRGKKRPQRVQPIWSLNRAVTNSSDNPVSGANTGPECLKVNGDPPGPVWQIVLRSVCLPTNFHLSKNLASVLRYCWINTTIRGLVLKNTWIHQKIIKISMAVAVAFIFQQNLFQWQSNFFFINTNVSMAEFPFYVHVWFSMANLILKATIHCHCSSSVGYRCQTCSQKPWCTTSQWTFILKNELQKLFKVLKSMEEHLKNLVFSILAGS